MMTVMSMIRRLQGVTQTDLAITVGVTQSEISLIERNKVTPNDEVFSAIAATLGIEKVDLLRDYTDFIRSGRSQGKV